MTNFQLDTKTLFLTIPQISENIDKQVAYNRIMDKYKDKLNSLIVSMENHKEEGKHLHLFIEFKSRFRSKLPDVFDFIADKHPNIQSARSKVNVIKYVIKDGDYITYNIDPLNYIKENKQHTVRQSKGDFHELAESIKDAKYSVKELNDRFPHLFLKYGEHIKKYMNFIESISNDEETAKYNEQRYKNPVWRPWQEYILNLAKSIPDDRTVNWIYDPKGNSGKSYIANYLRLYHNAYNIPSGKDTDIYRHYRFNKICIYDLTKTNMMSDDVLYSTIECFKNGYVLDTKYEGQCKSFIPPHIFIFSNALPDTSKLSNDRWNIINLENHDNYYVMKQKESYKTEEIDKNSFEYKKLKTQQILDMKHMREIASNTYLTHNELYINRYKYDETIKDFYDEFLKEFCYIKW